MTCIAGMVSGGVVYIGGDSAGVTGLMLDVRADTKVFRNGEFIFGFTSSFRMGQLLHYKFTPPAHKANKGIEAFMVEDFIEEVRKCLKDGGYAQKKDNKEEGGTFLVGYRGKLFCIESDYQIGENVLNFDAVGCGAAYAKGLLWGLRDSKLSPKNKIKKALEAAERFSAGVQRPFEIIQTN